MVQTLSQQGFNTISPSGGGIGPNGTPSGIAGLGVDLGGTPGGLAMTPNMGMGMALGLSSMSDLALMPTVSNGYKRNEDEERRGKMRSILKKIGRPKGRVSEEGICRLGRRVGFANDIDAENLTAEERVRKVGNRTVSIAGEAVVVDVDMKNHIPQEVQIMLSGEGDAISGMAEKAGQVLLQSLKGTDSLDRFAKGLDWIAKVDRLGGNKINGFEALGGMFVSLKRLYDEEVKLVGEKRSCEQAEIMAMCKKSGKPVAHERGDLGISLDYWQESRIITFGKANDTAMDVDSNASPSTNATPLGLHTLHLDLDRFTTEMFAPIRVSSTWLPEKLELRSDTPIPWQDPEPTFLSTPNQDDSMTDNNLPHAQPKLLPSLRFVARLDPPVVVPWETSTAILNSLGAVEQQGFPTPVLLNQLLVSTPMLPNGDVEQQKSVSVRRGPDHAESESTHVYRLHVARPDFGSKLEELPFSHPRQLVENLPLLRQWACFGALVRDVFSGDGPATLPNSYTSNGSGKKEFVSATNGSTQRLNLASDLRETLAVDVSLSSASLPTLGIEFPTLSGEGDIAIKLSVGLNGLISVAGTVCESADEQGKAVEEKVARKWARALEVSGGVVGVWIEWVRNEVHGS